MECATQSPEPLRRRPFPAQTSIAILIDNRFTDSIPQNPCPRPAFSIILEAGCGIAGREPIGEWGACKLRYTIWSSFEI